jgi:phage tail protein X
MTQYLPHVTREGERWDLLAWHYYRDVSKMPDLIDANPHVAVTEVLPSGVTLYVPVLPAPVLTLNHGLPPWRRG